MDGRTLDPMETLNPHPFAAVARNLDLRNASIRAAWPTLRQVRPFTRTGYFTIEYVSIDTPLSV